MSDRSRLLLLSGAFMLASVIPADADEGLWPVDHFPTQRVRAKYGAEIGKSWLDHVMHASVRLSNGCSASVVSSSGLVLTDNHCVSECAQTLNDPTRNAYADGFLADGKQEPRCDGLTAEVLSTITDVTSEVVQPDSGSLGASEASARARVISRIERDRCPAKGHRCQVVPFFGGGQYKLMDYRLYDHVSLVFSPGVAAAHYGPEVDPPFYFDVAFLRLYADGRPAATPDHLRWRGSQPKVGDLVFTAGSPRISERHLTMSQLETERSFSLPVELVESAELKGRLIRFGEESVENERSSNFQLDDLSNHYEYILTLFNTLNDAGVWAKKSAEEAALRAKAGGDIDAQFAIIDRAERRRRELAQAYESLDGGPSLSGAPSSKLYDYARTLVEGAIERAKPSADRSARFADARLPAVQQRLFEAGDVHRPLEELQLEAWLSRARDYARPGDPTSTLLLGGRTPRELAVTLSQSRLDDVQLRRALWAGGVKAVEASDDPMIRLLLRIEPATQAIRASWAKEVVEPESHAAQAIGRARLAALGADAYPDANRTLRISFGRIEGPIVEGRPAVAFTTVGDLYRFAANSPAYPLSPKWQAAKGRLSPGTVMNMLSTNDTINGNSGSPLLDSQAEVVGLFGGGDSAAESGDYAYDAATNRAYSLSADVILKALTSVYGANRLAEELMDGSTGSIHAK